MKKIILAASILITLLGCEVNTKGLVEQTDDIQIPNSEQTDNIEPEVDNTDSIQPEKGDIDNTQSETDNADSVQSEIGNPEAADKIPHEVLEIGNSERLEGNSVLHEEIGAQALKNMQIKEYLSLGDSVTIEKNKTSVLKRALTNFEIIKDPNYENRKAIVFYFTEENLTDTTINPGLYGISETPTESGIVIYKEHQLKLISEIEPRISELENNEEIVDDLYVYFKPIDPEVKSCRVGELKAKETRTCFTHYSYAGTGEYDIVQLVENTLNEVRAYKIKID